MSTLEPGRPASEARGCFWSELEREYITKDHDTYIFLSAATTEKIPNEHIIH